MGFERLDPDLIRRCQAGDDAAFADLIAEVGEDLYRYALSILRNHDDADEVYQEALIRIHRHVKNLREVKKFPGWARRIVLNQCHTLRAREARRGTTSWDALEDPPDVETTIWVPQGVETPRRAAQRSELGDRINAAISELPPRQRTCLVMFEIQGMPIKEIAADLGCSEGAVKFNLHQARHRLQESLKGYLVQTDSLPVSAAGESG